MKKITIAEYLKKHKIPLNAIVLESETSRTMEGLNWDSITWHVNNIKKRKGG